MRIQYAALEHWYSEKIKQIGTRSTWSVRRFCSKPRQPTFLPCHIATLQVKIFDADRVITKYSPHSGKKKKKKRTLPLPWEGTVRYSPASLAPHGRAACTKSNRSGAPQAGFFRLGRGLGNLHLRQAQPPTGVSRPLTYGWGSTSTSKAGLKWTGGFRTQGSELWDLSKRECFAEELWPIYALNSSTTTYCVNFVNSLTHLHPHLENGDNSVVRVWGKAYKSRICRAQPLASPLKWEVVFNCFWCCLSLILKL